MTTSTGPAGNGRAGALGRALVDVRLTAATAAQELLHHVPDTGDQATGRVVDDFVEQASDALRALAESLGDTLGRLGSPGVSGAKEAVDDLTPREGAPGGWGW